MSVTKNDMVIKIAQETGIEQLKVKQVVQMTLDGIIEILAREKRYELRNFGVFEVRIRKARKARNPRTGQEVMVPSKAVVTFKSGKIMEEEVEKISRQSASENAAPPKLDGTARLDGTAAHDGIALKAIAGLDGDKKHP